MTKFAHSALTPENVFLYSCDRGRPIQSLNRSRAIGNRRGQTFGVYKQVEYILNPYDCQHQVTMCRACAPKWFEDSIIKVFAHGSSVGYDKGCRCIPCVKHNGEMKLNAYNKRVQLGRKV